MNILVTGGCGYIGSELIQKLILNPKVDKIDVVDNLSSQNLGFFFSNNYQSSKIKFHKIDLLDNHSLSKIVKNIDIVYHLAGVNDNPKNSNTHYLEQINHWGTVQLANAIEEAGIKKVIYLSTTEVYGLSETEFSEISEPNPKSQYAISKQRAEQQILRLGQRMKAIVIRSGQVYGHSHCFNINSSEINRLFFESFTTNRTNIIANGRHINSYISLDILTSYLSKIVDNEIESGVYNLSGHNLQQLDVLESLQEIFNDLEFIFINPHLSLMHNMISKDQKIKSLIDVKNTTLAEDLILMKNKMSY